MPDARGLCHRVAILWLLLAMASPLAAQAPDPHAGHGLPGAPDASTPVQHQHDHAHAMLGPGDLPMSRMASGTSWIPDDSLMRAESPKAGEWTVMLMGQAFGQVLHENGYFGGTQGGSINWLMGMGQRRVGKGWLQLSAMGSVEPWTIPGCGYPNMLATGELCDGEPIHEKQHPHDLVMELAASYTWPVSPALSLQVYGGPAGEPALGPAAFPHRGSSMPNLMAPIAHHWLDATHITYGVATAGVFTRQWKVEGSVFNGREPDENRRDLDLARLDSFSGRVWWMPSSRWAIQVSAGRLREAEPPHEDLGTADKDLVTASVSYSRRLAATDGVWASTVAWGRAEETGSVPTQFLLMETSLARSACDTWFGRAEIGTKSPHDISVHGLADSQGMGKLQGGYVRHLRARRGWQPGAGFTVSAAIANALLGPRYGSRVTWGSGVFITLRPEVMR
ncbi:MAG: hypothetical protein ABL971_05435 [Vicinamibacterales bacterium]